MPISLAPTHLKRSAALIVGAAIVMQIPTRMRIFGYRRSR